MKRSDYLPAVLTADWQILDSSEDGAAYQRGEQTVIVSAAIENDNRWWLHVSTAFPARMPTWQDLVEVKRIFMGPKRQAVQVIPSDERYINQHNYCLHLFCALSDDDPIPDFTRGGNSL